VTKLLTPDEIRRFDGTHGSTSCAQKGFYTDKKENKIFLIYKEIQKVAKHPHTVYD
jgi:hypothetical protein